MGHLGSICPAVLTQVLLPSCPYTPPTPPLSIDNSGELLHHNGCTVLFPWFYMWRPSPNPQHLGPPPFVSSSSSFTQIIHSSWSVFVSPSRVESTVQKFFYPQTQTDFLCVRFSFHLTFSLDLVTFQTQLRTRCLETHQVTFSSRTAPPLVHSVDCGVCRVFLAHGRVTFGLKSCVFVLILTQQAHKQTKRIQTLIGLVER